MIVTFIETTDIDEQSCLPLSSISSDWQIFGLQKSFSYYQHNNLQTPISLLHLIHMTLKTK